MPRSFASASPSRPVIEARPPRILSLDDRRRLHAAVQHDRELAADVVAGELGEDRRPSLVQGEADAGGVGPRGLETEDHPRVGDLIAGQIGFGGECVEVLPGVFGGRAELAIAPHQNRAAGEHSHVVRGTLDFFQHRLGGVEVLRRAVGVTRVGVDLLQKPRERVLDGGGVGGGAVTRSAGPLPASDGLVHHGQGLEELLLGLDQPELQPRGLAHQFLGALRILETGELNDDPVLSLLLDHRLRHAELVDAVADDLDGAVHLVAAALVLGDLLQVHLVHQVRAALQVEPQLHGVVADLGDPGGIRAALGRVHGVIADGRNHVPAPDDQHEDNDGPLPAQTAHRDDSVETSGGYGHKAHDPTLGGGSCQRKARGPRGVIRWRA